MNPFSKMESRVKAVAPAAELRRDLAKKPKGTSFLEIVQGGFTASVEFRPGHGFGITVPQGAVYGEGPDEVVADEESAIARVVELLKATDDQLDRPAHKTSKSGREWLREANAEVQACRATPLVTDE
jgi:hypothetical protein